MVWVSLLQWQALQQAEYSRGCLQVTACKCPICLPFWLASLQFPFCSPCMLSASLLVEQIMERGGGGGGGGWNCSGTHKIMWRGSLVSMNKFCNQIMGGGGGWNCSGTHKIMWRSSLVSMNKFCNQPPITYLETRQPDCTCKYTDVDHDCSAQCFYLNSQTALDRSFLLSQW